MSTNPVRYPEGIEEGTHGDLLKKGFQGHLVKTGHWKKRLILLTDSEMIIYRPKHLNKPFRSFVLKNSFVGEGDEEVGKPWIVFILEPTDKLHYIATNGRTEQTSWIKIFGEKCGSIRCGSLNEARKNLRKKNNIVEDSVVVEKIKELNIENKINHDFISVTEERIPNEKKTEAVHEKKN